MREGVFARHATKPPISVVEVSFTIFEVGQATPVVVSFTINQTG